MPAPPHPPHPSAAPSAADRRFAADWRFALPLAAGTCALQLLGYLWLAAPGDWAVAYRSLWAWDSAWYLSIAELGYRTPLPPRGQALHASNVAFFPAYPLLGRWLARLYGTDGQMGLLLAAQGCALGFWAFFHALLAQAGVSRRGRLLAGVLLVCFPSAFYLQAAYSEATFLLGLTAFLFFALRPRPAVLGAGAAGFLMTAARIVGLPLAGVPTAVAVLGALLGRREGPREGRRGAGRGVLVRHAAVALLAAAGAGLFFLFCHLRWGRWDLYMWTQQVGWGIQPDPGALLQPRVWTWVNLRPASLWPYAIHPDRVSRSGTALALWAVAAGLPLELLATRWLGVRGWRERLPFHLAAAGMLAVSVSGLAGQRLVSMVRYLLPVFVMLLVAHAHLWSRLPPRLARVRWLLALLALGLAGWGALMQAHFIEGYSRGEWVS